MAILTGDRYLESLVKFVENNAEPLIEGSLVLKLNPLGLRYVQSRLEALAELESLIAGAPVDYLRAYVSDLGDHRAIEQLRRILRLLPSLKVVSMLPSPTKDPTPLSLLPFARLKILELRGCDLSASAAHGLLELRHTLEKLICHNSTDALRHVFASRISDIKDSPQWNRLSFVSCARNSLVLMDESLQLLPVIETLDLSRNRFAKVDNLRKCTKLKHLDLGFNQLRTVASFSEVSCRIVKLVLRNNALTTLHGIENLKSLEGLDLSYNIISNFSEIEILAGLSSLKGLWLEGNPLCTAGWYRAQVFSFFPYPDELKLDERKISKREIMKRQIIIASRQKRPASFGFYSPAKEDAESVDNVYTKRKKISRLVSIESDERSSCIFSDRDSISFDDEKCQSKEEKANSEEEAEGLDLMNRIENMKKERSGLWLQEFKEWINSENCVDNSEYRETFSRSEKQNNLRRKMRGEHHLGETSRYVSDSNQASGDESSTNIFESDTSFADTSTGLSTRRFSLLVGPAASNFFMGSSGGDSQHIPGNMMQNQENLISLNSKACKSVDPCNSYSDSAVVPSGVRTNANNTFVPLTAIDDIIESQSSSACPGSPPHYQRDILQRRHNLEEEFLQLSAESLSVASSDSDTSCSIDDVTEFSQYIPEVDQHLIDKYSGRSLHGYNDSIYSLKQNGELKSVTHAEGNPADVEAAELESSSCLCSNKFPSDPTNCHGGETPRSVKQEDVGSVKKTRKKRTKKRIVSLAEEKNVFDQMEPLNESNGNIDVSVDDKKAEGPRPCYSSNFLRSSAEVSTRTKQSKLIHSRSEDVIAHYFNSSVADSAVNESCRQYTHCSSLIQDISGCRESEVAVLQSSEQKLYIFLIGGTCDGSEITLQQIGCHRVEEVKEVFVGLGLQVVRVFFERDVSYLFITRSADISRQLLCALDISESRTVKENLSLRSLELVQVDLFERHVCGGSRMNIFQYSMVSFKRNNIEDELWLSRSLFVLERNLLVCTEDIEEFGLLPEKSSSSSYFSLDWCCSVLDVTEMVIESKEDNLYITLSLARDASVFPPSERQDKADDAALKRVKSTATPLKWKLKWFSEESLHNFVALLKAISTGTTTSPLLVHSC